MTSRTSEALSGSPLLSTPEGASITYARGLMVEARAGAAPTLSLWTAPNGSGTPVTWRDDARVTWAFLSAQHPRARSGRALSAEWIEDLLEQPDRASDLSGVFALIVVDKRQHRVLLAGDRLGVQGVHFGTDGEGTWRASTHLLWLLLASRHDGRVNNRGFLAHMAFGYGVGPDRDVYDGIETLPPSGYATFDGRHTTRGVYWQSPEPFSDNSLGDAATLVSALQLGMTARVDHAAPFLGLTAGKDSLCLAAVVPSALTPLTGTLGTAGCADRLQAASVARDLGWAHVSSGVCPTVQFGRWSDHIAFHSAGLATASYADMAAFVERHVPQGSTFVMGEGGECVRDFFRTDDRPMLDRLVTDYMTPVEFLRQTLAPHLVRALDGYPASLLSPLCHSAGAIDDERFASRFYRFHRMTGNFSLRHAVLSVIRPKVSPFLDSGFIDATYGVSLAEHRASAIHRRIITSVRPALVTYFDAPMKAAVSTQAWDTRVAGLADTLKSRLRAMCAQTDDVLDRSGVLALSAAATRRAGRSVFHLFRLYSFARARVMLRLEAADWLRSIRVMPLTSTVAAEEPAHVMAETNAATRQVR